MAHHQSKYSAQETNQSRASLHLHPSAFIPGQDTDSSHNPSPNSTIPIPSPDTLDNSPSFRDSESELAELDDEREPSFGPHRSRSVSSGKSDREKRKRSRVTPEQLGHLERFFAADRSPTATRRREISDLLGMQERQTQIWFQNRRAKAKLQDGKHNKGRGGSVDAPPPESPPQLSTGFQMDLHNLIHEDEPVTIIPCTELSIGTWRRIASTVAKHDLVAYVCYVKRCLTWFIHSGGFGFKMEIPFETIIDTEFTNAAPGSGLASFLLSQPPIFYLENTHSHPDTPLSRHWKRCSDWTEGQQATHVLRHDLIGSAVQLAHLLRSLHANSSLDISLQQPPYRAEQSMSPMELPLPPMAGLTGSGYHYQNGTVGMSPADQAPQRKRLPSGVTMHTPDSAYSNDSSRPPSYSATSSISFSQHPYDTISSHPTESHYNGTRYPGYPTLDSSHTGSRPPSVDEYPDMSTSHGLVPRPYSTQPVPRAFYNEMSPSLIHPYQIGEQRMRRVHSSPNVGRGGDQGSRDQGASSPPLLTTPYHPPPHLLDNPSSGHTEQHNSASPPAMPNHSNVKYGVEKHRSDPQD